MISRLDTVLIVVIALAGVSAKSAECEQCELTVDLIHKAWGDNTTEECVGDLADFVCTTFHIEDHFVCQMIVSEFEPEAVYILGQIIFEPHQICGLLLDDCGTFFDPLNATWHLPMPPNQPTPVVKQPVQAGKPKLRVLHLTDIHMDTQYTVGEEVQCGEPQCCRPAQDPEELSISSVSGVKQPAGQWGTVGNCDLPYATLTNMMQFIQKTHKDLDYVLVSGDLMSHAVYEYTQSTHAAMVKNISDTIRAYMGNTPVYFAVGNHEGVPIDNFAPHFAPKQWHMDWLYDAMADAWKGWVPQDQQKTVKFIGSYMVKLFPGLRLISINNPLGGDRVNFWMYMNQTDPDGVLTWTMEQLKEAEAAGDKVHIVAHIPGGDGEALEGWAINYYNVVNRFQNTISGQFFGHTHSDEFYIVYEDPNNASTRPTAMVYSAPSATTYSEYFPAYRIYSIDGNYTGSTYQVVDYEEWFFNLTEANSNPQATPTWKQLFASVNTEYGLTSQIPSEWNKFIDRMYNDDALFQKYLLFRYRRNSFDGAPGCNSKCKREHLCAFRQFHHNKQLCQGLGDLDDMIPRSPLYSRSSLQKSESLESNKNGRKRPNKRDPKCKL